MKKKPFYLMLTLVLIFSFSLATAVPTAAATLEVGSGKTYATIAAAISAANDGDTITVYDGTYGKVVVNKELTIQAAEGNSPVVDGGGSGACFGIYKSAGLSDVTIDGFEIQNAAYGIWIYGAGTASTTYNNITLSNNNIHNHQWGGIYVTDSTINGLTISNNDISLCGAGISAANGAAIDGMVADTNILTDNNMGFSLIKGTFSNTTVSNCHFEDNNWEHMDLGCWGNWPSLSDIEITGCEFTGIGLGVYVESNFTDYDIVFRHNSFSLSWGVGINNMSTNIVDAKCNWWDDISGPFDDKDLDGLGLTNPEGSGAAVGGTLWWGPVDYVDYEPWLLSSEGPCYGYVGIADCFDNVKNHGQFVSCIAKFTQGLVKDGAITAEERAAIVNWAAQSDIGK